MAPTTGMRNPRSPILALCDPGFGESFEEGVTRTLRSDRPFPSVPRGRTIGEPKAHVSGSAPRGFAFSSRPTGA